MENTNISGLYTQNSQKICKNSAFADKNAILSIENADLEPKTLNEARKYSCIWGIDCSETDCDECQYYCSYRDGQAKEHYEIAKLMEHWYDWLEAWNDFVEIFER